MPKRPRITSVYHDQLPEFDADHRKRYFYLESAFQHLILKSVRGNHNKVLIIVAFGYFKATAQFFDKAHDKDIAYVAIRLNVDPKTIRWEDYNRQTFANHRQLILDYLSFRPFDPSAKTEVIEKLERLARTQASYSSCFHSVVELLQKGKIEIPSYRKIDSLIKSTYQQHEYKLIQSVATLLSANDKHLFDELLRKSATGADVWSKYRITLLKRFSQSVKPGKIKENVAAFDTLKPLFDIANPIVEQLDLTIEGVRHYANSVNKSQVFQVKRRSDPQRYLQLATFVAHQFYRLQDILIESLIVTVTRALNEAEQKAKDELYQQRVRQSQNASALVNDSENLLDILEHVKQALTNANLTDDEKIQKALKYLQPKRVAIETVANNIAAVQEDIEQMSGEALYYRFLEEGSLKLQTRCNDIVKRLHFLPDSANKALIKAVNRLQKTEGTVDTKSPVS